MGISDWGKQFRQRAQTRPLSAAVSQSGWDLVNGFLHRTVSKHIGTTIWEKEWDIAIILDAARVDTFREVSEEYDWIDSDSVSSYWSVGSYSGSWVAGTFDTERYSTAKNTAYISGNDWPTRNVSWEPELPINKSELPLFIQASKHCWREIDGIETVDPVMITDLAIDAWQNQKQHGFDKMIIHYMQPHQPFIGHPDITSSANGDQNQKDQNQNDESRTNFGVWDRAYRGEVSKQEIQPAYRDNLRYVLNQVQRLKESVDARIGITADHGNALGELGQWGHPAGSLHPSVRKVPWCTVQGNQADSRDIETTVSDVTSDPESVSEDVENRLEQLGYSK